LARELEQFGPHFELPNQDEIEEEVKDLYLNDGTKNNSTSQTIADPSGTSKVMHKKGKVASKSTGQKYQFQIMKSSGVPDEEIVKFADSNHWIYYFPPLAMVGIIIILDGI